VTLDPGARQRVSVDLPRDAFAFYDAERREWVVEPGPADVQVGSSSREIQASKLVDLR
jgi:beta-glucosidase